MKRLLPLAVLAAALFGGAVWAQTTADIVSRQTIERTDGTYERVKITVTLDDGSKRSYWPYVKQGTETDKALTDQAVAIVDADIAAAEEAEDNAPIPKEEVDAVMAKLEKDKKLPAGVDTWDEAKAEASLSAVTP